MTYDYIRIDGRTAIYELGNRETRIISDTTVADLGIPTE